MQADLAMRVQHQWTTVAPEIDQQMGWALLRPQSERRGEHDEAGLC
jgi:hypothetical protein